MLDTLDRIWIRMQKLKSQGRKYTDEEIVPWVFLLFNIFQYYVQQAP